MMKLNKAAMIQSIQDIKRSDKTWVKKADWLVNGIDGIRSQRSEIEADESFMPLSHKTNDFDKWFNENGVLLSGFKSIGHLMSRVKEQHDSLHEIYAHIYTLLVAEPKNRSLLQKVLSFNGKKIQPSEKNQARIHLEYLKKTYDEFVEVLEILETRVRALEYTELVVR
jgi:hypothetical protein